MSLKDLFGKTSEKVVTKQEIQKLYDEAESEGYLEESVKDRERFLPYVNFQTASNFARYGSAEKYYSDAIKNIYQRYPYDGSKKEKLEWRNASSQFDLYIFDKVYPKTTGYVNLGSGLSSNITTGSITYRFSASPQYVLLKGGPNAGVDNKFDTGNIYDISKNRESNLGLTDLGNTVEFWFKDNVSTTASASDYQYCYFDLWNGTTSGSANYTRLTVERNSTSFLLTYVSGTSGVVKHPVVYAIDKSNWHHYAFTFNGTSPDLEINLYVDGTHILKDTLTNSGNINLANNADIQATIGSYITNPDATETSSWLGIGSLFGSVDEFRFWKEARTSQQIYRNWSNAVGGGSNTDDSNTELGVYYKFNEGIVDNATINSLDSSVLDYSGRISNGVIYNYSTSVRSTGSAIDTYFDESRETKDPIIYSSNPLVSSALEEYTLSGSYYDENNNSNIYKSLPAWIIEEAEAKGLNDLSNLIQIISSYFDTLHIQIENLPKIKNSEYIKNDEKPKPFINNILNSYGFENIDIFNDATFLEEILSRNEQKNFEDKIDNVKNTIYQNIYNNLSNIYKSKGTENSLRNLIRCFGVDDELVKINLYANNAQYEVNDSYNYVSTPKKFVDFNNNERYSSTVFQKNKTGDDKTIGYIPYTNKLNNFNSSYAYAIPLTIQTEIIFPKKVSTDYTNYDLPDFSSVSLFGIHTAKTDNTDLTWDNEKFVFAVSAIKRNNESSDVYFKLSGSFDGYPVELTSSWYNEVYDNNKWNLAVRISHDKLFNAFTTSGSQIGDYNIELIGYNSILDSAVNEPFVLKQTIPKANAEASLLTNKRLYVGAHLQNFTGSVLEKTDVKISSTRFWFDYLTNEEIKNHSYDSSNYGRKNVNWIPHYIKTSAYINTNDNINALNAITVADTLALHWDFSNVTASNASGEFIVEDITSGSAQPATDYAYDWYAKLVNRQFTGLGYNFPINDTQVVNKEYLYSAKLQNFENLNGSNLIRIPNTDSVTRTKNTSPVTFYISIEKSMSQVINNEILNWFSTIKDFNNLIGNPVERYKQEYSGLAHLRKLFFNTVNNDLDFEKFLTFYKWIDSSISMMISQLIPASANVSDKVRNIIESHMLERNKVHNKLPTIEFKGEIVDIVASTGKAFSYQSQNAPSSPAGKKWLKQRVNRTETLILGGESVNTPLEPENDADREIIRQVVNYSGGSKLPIFYSVDSKTFYEGKKDNIKIFGKPYEVVGDKLIIVESNLNLGAITNRNTSQLNIGGQEETGSLSNLFQNNKLKVKNYNKNYEVVQLTGRFNNNKSFIDAEGNVSGAYTNSGLGFSDRTLLSRSVNQSIFVERFSAPGGPEVNSRGALDQTAEEYSVYNTLNNRNLRVRNQLRSWLAETASLDSSNPSYHQYNKNPYHYPAALTGNVIKTQYDNAFISHAIPRSDTQYRWIAASNNSTSSLSFYTSDAKNSITLNINSGAALLVDYEVPYAPTANINLTSNKTSSAHDGVLYDSGGLAGNSGQNEKYYLSVVPKMSDESTYNTAISIDYSLTGSGYSDASGALYTKLQIYTADDPSDLNEENFLFPDIANNVLMYTGSQYLPLAISGNLSSAYWDYKQTNVYSMDTDNSGTVYFVGNFTHITSTLGLTPVPGFFAYNYNTKEAYNPLTASLGGFQPSPQTSSHWFPRDILYTECNDNKYLIFFGTTEYYDSKTLGYNPSKSFSVYNLSKNLWNRFAGSDGITLTNGKVKNLGFDRSSDAHYSDVKLFKLSGKRAKDGLVGVTNIFLRDINGNTIYPIYDSRNYDYDLFKFSIDPGSEYFCSGAAHLKIGIKLNEGYVSPTKLIVAQDNNDNLYIARRSLTGSAENDDKHYYLAKISPGNSTNQNDYQVIRNNPFFTTVNSGKTTNFIPREILCDTTSSNIYIIGTSPTDDGGAFVYNQEEDTFINITGGYLTDYPVFNVGDNNYPYGNSEYRQYSFITKNYLYVFGKYGNNNIYNKKINTIVGGNSYFRYNVGEKYPDNDNYFAPIKFNDDKTRQQTVFNVVASPVISLKQYSSLNEISSNIFIRPDSGYYWSGHYDPSYNTVKYISEYYPSKYNQVNYLSGSYGTASNSLEFTGSNFLITWVTNDLAGNNFQLNWNKDVPYIVKREEYNNYLGFRTNALPDYYFTNPSVEANTNTNLIYFYNTASFTASYALNAYLLNINGPYQYASWQQIRNAENPIVVKSRKNNEIIVQDKPIIENRQDSNGQNISFIRTRAETFTKYKEPAVTFNKPMLHNVIVTGSKIPVELISTYDNNKQKFTNEDLTLRLASGERQDPQAHDVLLQLENGLYEPRPEIINASYQQYLYPRSELATLKEITTKPNYPEENNFGENGYNRNIADIRSFWKDEVTDRKRKNASESTFVGSYNSLNIPEYKIGYRTFSLDYGLISFTPTEYTRRTQYRNNYGSTLDITKSLVNSYNTIWSLDNTGSSLGIISNYNPNSTGSAETINGTNRFSLNYSYISELQGGDDLVDLVEALKLPAGSYLYANKVANGQLLERVEYFNYFDNTLLSRGDNYFERYTYIPKPSIINKIHVPATTFNDLRFDDGVADLKESYSYNIINNGYYYFTNKLAGKNPWHNSYEEYYEDIKPHSTNYSIIPEFRLHNHLDFFLRDNAANFNTIITGSYLSLDGAGVNFLEISESYNTTNIVKTDIYNDVDKGDNVLNITVNGIKKLLPYKGFYPSERSTQLVSLFQKSFFGFENEGDFKNIGSISGFFGTALKDENPRYATSNTSGSTLKQYGTPILQQMQTVLQPLFAPGILFNTIKSGIAVDWPIILENKYDVPYSSSISGGIAPFYKYTSFLYGSEVTSPVENQLHVIRKVPDYRLPFEALVNFKDNLPDQIENKVLFYLDPTRLSVDCISGTQRALIRTPSYDFVNNNRYNKTSDYIDDRYKFAINNYLAEIPSFFLDEGKLTNFISKPGPVTLAPNKRYEMYLKLSKDDNFKMVVSNPAVSSSIFYTYNYSTKSIFLPEGSVFGPPFQYTNYLPTTPLLYTKAFIEGNAFELYKDPAYAPYTPPYFYGDKILKIYLDVPQIDNDTGRSWSIEEIIKNVKYEEMDSDIDSYFLSASNTMTGVADGYELSPAYISKMPLTSSIRTDGITSIKEIEYDENGSPIKILNDNPAWVIQTKFETPILNFNNSTNINELTSNTYITSSVTKALLSNQTSSHYNAFVNTGFTGMWGGYGELPTNKENIFLSLYGPKVTFLTQSLAEVVGFAPAVKKIGQLASTKEISEAIVLIPYTVSYPNHEGKEKYAKTIHELLGENGVKEEKDRGVGPYYFSVDPILINNILEIPFSDSKTTVQTIKNAIKNKSNDQYIAKTSIYRTINSMTEYNLPPHLDWVTNRNITPFVMYIFEFKHILDKEDLKDIWQGVMPKIAINSVKDSISFSHNLNINEFFEGKKIPPDVRWKVFKVKKKAKNSYYELMTESAIDDRYNFKFKNDSAQTPAYSYNWPYDYFSLVELVNIEAKLDSGYALNVETTVNTGQTSNNNNLVNRISGLQNRLTTQLRENIRNTLLPATVTNKLSGFFKK